MVPPLKLRCAACGREMEVKPGLKKPEACPVCGTILAAAAGNLEEPPGDRKSSPEPAASATPVPPDLAGKKVLLVDDDRDFLQLMKLRLRPTGCVLVTAMDGLAATSVFRKENPDLIFLDLGLPAGDGFVLLERFSRAGSLAPVIVMSSRDPAAAKGKALGAGARAFLPKTADTGEIFAAIRQVFP